MDWGSLGTRLSQPQQLYHRASQRGIRSSVEISCLASGEPAIGWTEDTAGLMVLSVATGESREETTRRVETEET